MSNFVKTALFFIVLMLSLSCGNVSIKGTLEDAPSSELVVKLLDVNRYQVADTISVDAGGSFSCRLNMEKGHPEFVYLFYKDTKVASLLLEAGDRVRVVADTLGHWTVEGSAESEKLAGVEAGYAEISAVLGDLSERVSDAEGAAAEQLREDFTREYIAYYRDCVRYIMSNSRSMTVVPVLFASLGENLPVFGQTTDAIHFSNAADSLETVYPDSKYVKALRSEARKRMNYMELSSRLASAEVVDFLDIELPDVKAETKKLTDVHSKVTLVYFWTASDAAQKMFNLDVLAPVYRDFHSKGFEIYQISLDRDKGLWAKVVREQNLPWTNVCDSRGAESLYAAIYNVQNLPSAFIIGGDGLQDTKITDEKSLRKLVAGLLF